MLFFYWSGLKYRISKHLAKCVHTLWEKVTEKLGNFMLTIFSKKGVKCYNSETITKTTKGFSIENNYCNQNANKDNNNTNNSGSIDNESLIVLQLLEPSSKIHYYQHNWLVAVGFRFDTNKQQQYNQ